MSYDIDITEQVVTVYDNGARWHGSFYDTADQPNAGATATNKVQLNTTDLSAGVSIVSNSRITIANAGIYNIAFSAQIAKTDSGTDTIQIWLCKNGDPVANSNTELTLVGNQARSVAAWNFFVRAAAGDYYEICWHSDDTAIFLDAAGTASNPTRPAIPSVILTVNQI